MKEGALATLCQVLIEEHQRSHCNSGEHHKDETKKCAVIPLKLGLKS